MSLLTGDDDPEAVHFPDWEQPAPAGDLRRRPRPSAKRHVWSRWRGHRRRSLLIQDPPDLAGDGADDRYGADDDGYRAGDNYGPDHGYGYGHDAGPPDSRNGFFLDRGPGPDDYPRGEHDHDGYRPDDYLADRITEDLYPESGHTGFPDSGPTTLSYRDAGFAEAGYQDPGHAETGSAHLDSGHLEAAYQDSGSPRSGYSGPEDAGPTHPGASDPGGWYETEDDGFRASPIPEDNPWHDGGAGEPDLEDEPPGRPAGPLGALLRRREPRYRDAEGPRKLAGSARRLGAILLAGASVAGVALYLLSILAAGSRSFTGVVSNGIASLNFETSGRVGSVRVHLGQMVRQGQVLATEAGAADTAAVRADRAAITADKANLAALQADGSAATSITAAQAQLERDRAHRAADLMKLVATEIVAPSSGIVVAIYGQPGETVSHAGLSSSAGHTQALPVIALRAGGGWEVSLLIPQTGPSRVKVGEDVTISVPAARLSGVKGMIRELSPTAVSSAGGAAYQAVVRVLGRTRTTPLSGLTANVQLGSLR